MIPNKENLDLVFRGFNTRFNETIKDVPFLWDKVAMKVDSASESEDYLWLSDAPMMTEWRGSRKLQNLAGLSYRVKNQKFEATMELDEDDVEDDKVGLYRPRIEELAWNAMQHRDYLIFSLMAEAWTKIGPDGKAFIAANHQVAGSSVSNTGGGSSTPWYLLDVTKPVRPFALQVRREPRFRTINSETDAQVFLNGKYLYGVDDRKAAGFGRWQYCFGSKVTLDGTGFAAAVTAMRSFKKDNGVSLAVNPSLLVIPPTLESAARTLLKAPTGANGAANIWFNFCDYVVVPWLA